ncbi:MAG TPA: gluconate 2-dehydrogenase subunit 3 family protein [Bryobacteraceae bacterium]|nr:gluconate 2-dehydrogenase subunit 3 family protein [Bryobacteraceae bacterium]
MKEDNLRRRDVVQGLAAGLAGPAVIVPVQSLFGAAGSMWKPRFFTAAQADLVEILSELIIPQTDTPGARAARVVEHVDRTLFEEIPDVQSRFREGLAGVNQKSQALYSLDFRNLPVSRQTSILTAMAKPEDAGHEFFEEIRRRTVFAYYTSEIGIHRELNYQGHQVLDRWPGCPHPDHHGDADQE